MTWIIDAGHGGKDAGAVNGTFLEKDWNLEIAKKVHEELKKNGVQSVLTRTADTTLDLTTRCKNIKKIGAKKGISIHLNSATNKTAQGFEFIHSIYSDGKFEEILKQEYSKISELKPRPTTIFTKKHGNGDYYALHRDTGSVRMTIVESAFISNESDKNFVFSENGKMKVVTAIVTAILKEEGKTVVKKTETTTEKMNFTMSKQGHFHLKRKLKELYNE